MYIQEVVIDGFKSYSTRTVISGWDSQFNAITGLNGSGKSNILDAICFVLGITNLTQVRASNLQDLVYKQGQAGITKATVSIIFSNSDPKQSPVGYEHCETITVTRQVIIGGRNKYLVNGKNAQASTVQNLFHSVQLNVNNPHFLIMQGRITKVLNMKPLETLGMIEEAAGTRMFEAKKQAALKTIEKKQTKVDEIDKVLAEEITPTLEKLRAERSAYLKWASNNTECERLARFCVAYDFVSAERTRDSARASSTEAAEASKAATTRAAASRSLAALKDGELHAAEEARAAGGDAQFSSLLAAEEALSKELVKASAAHANRRGALREEEKARAALSKSLAEAEAGAAALAAALEKQRTEAASAAAASASAATELSSAIARLNAAAAGMTLDEGGGNNSSSGGGSTLADQLIAARRRVTELSATLSSSEMRLKHLRAVGGDLEKAAKAAAEGSRTLGAVLSRTKASHASKAAKLAATGFDPAAEERDRLRRDGLLAEVAALGDAVESESGSLGSAAEFHYDVGAMGPGWEASKRVFGPLAALLRVTMPEAAVALEVGAGGKLYQVVIDSEVTGKALLEKGRLRRRATFIPLSHIRHGRISDRTIAEARRVAGGPDRVWPALELLQYSPDVAPAVEYAFGGMFIARDAATAKAVTFADGVRTPCVTFDGDMFDPAGTLEGGSKPEAGAGTAPLLTRVERLASNTRALASKRTELKMLEASIASGAKVAAAAAGLAAEVELAAHEVALAESRLAASAGAANDARIAENTAALASEEAAVAAARSASKEAAARVKTLEDESANVVAAREGRVKAAEKASEAAKRAAAAAEKRAKEAAHALDAAGFELDSARKEVAALEVQVAAAALTLASASSEAAGQEEAVGRVRERHDAAKVALEAARAALAAADKALKALAKERDAAASAAEEADADVKKHDARSKAVAKEAAAAQQLAADLLARHAWIAGDRQFFGRAHTDYDFSARDPEEATSRLATLEKQQGELERKINKKVIGMIESAEREYGDLVSKKRIIENDKSKINKVITELDEKKNEALRTTWAKVNKDFGSIFSALLPGVTAKLEPPEGGTVLEGLAVRVAFNGVWKESLTELSGGQRSLLALSLILALLLFKPAPMYILDEVDAALDLSHTQNIGHMIRTHFSKSQFIVVSLKQGMFSNANVIYRTLFVEGVGSTVTRTVPAPGALAALTDGAGAAAVPSKKGKAAAARMGGGDAGGARPAKHGLEAAAEAEAEEEEAAGAGLPAAKRRGGPLAPVA